MLATYRFSFNDRHGVDATYGYTLNTQRYALGGNSSALRTNAHEIAAAYVISAPMRRWTPFALAGIGALVLAPDGSNLGSQTRPAFVYGGGADVDLSNRWFVRMQFRGLVYNSPVIGLATIASKRITH